MISMEFKIIIVHYMSFYSPYGSQTDSFETTQDYVNNTELEYNSRYISKTFALDFVIPRLVSLSSLLYIAHDVVIIFYYFL